MSAAESVGVSLLAMRCGGYRYIGWLRRCDRPTFSSLARMKTRVNLGPIQFENSGVSRPNLLASI